MPICSLCQILRIACLCNSPLASCGPQRITDSGSLGSGSLRGGSLGSWITVRDPHQLWVHANYVFTQSSGMHPEWVAVHQLTPSIMPTAIFDRGPTLKLASHFLRLRVSNCPAFFSTLIRNRPLHRRSTYSVDGLCTHNAHGSCFACAFHIAG